MGDKIRSIRRARNMTQAELCEKSGVSRGTLIALERNQTKNVMLDTLFKLACALEVTVDAFF